MKTILALLCSVLIAQSAIAVELPAESLALDQWATLDANSGLSGRIVLPQSNGLAAAVADATVVLVGERDELLRSKTDSSGRFQVSKMNPGIYAMSVFKKGIFACGALHVVSMDHPAASAFPNVPEFVAAKIDSSLIKSAMIRYLPPTRVRTITSVFANNELASVARVVKRRHQERIVQHAGGLRGSIGVAGATNGQLIAADSMNVLIIRDGEEVARSITDMNGQFEVADLPLGVYSLLAVGPAGMGCVGFVLVDGSKVDLNSQVAMASDVQLTSQPFGTSNQGYSNGIGIQVAPMPQVFQSVETSFLYGTIVSDEVIDERIVGEEIIDNGFTTDGFAMDGVGAPLPGGGYVPGGGFGGGGGGFGGGGGGFGSGGFGGGGSGFGGGGGGFGGGGGGFGGGGGGLGGLAALGALGAAVAVGASNNNNGNVIVPSTPVSAVAPPAVP